jgi:hypothetical protein
MPELSEISYNRDACIVAVTDYYDFLTKMYLHKSCVIKPPQDGWPTITTESMKDLGKTDEVISLLRHLPYICDMDERYRAEAIPSCIFSDWQTAGYFLGLGQEGGEGLRIISENISFYKDVPPHVIGLTRGEREDDDVFLLDTELGIVYWPECPGEIRHSPSREPVEDDPYDYAPKNEADWRADGAAWPVSDFFELLKDQFRELNYVPVSPWRVDNVHSVYSPRRDGLISMVQSIYRKHGWPDLENYRKQECLEAIRKAIDDLYPGESDFLDDEEESLDGE